ncbi:hypothetical protein CDCA_CDCA08G2490 [Cyanidium caldarium]|uniref:Pre-rRNA-processing protein TSR2 homolog n=1 Tax=Cyanidium caldarium TaxID=2771 RepID=A0AAV9IVX0_CYACA|nr:hypothetical protein CDCA_CDCA08G2490 [Cyanidium caldarium]
MTSSRLYATEHEALLAGVEAVFRRWTAMRLARGHAWAGAETDELIDELAADIVALILNEYRREDGSSVPYSATTVVSWLYDFFEDDCTADIEDGSVEQVGEVLERLRAAVAQAATSSTRGADGPLCVPEVDRLVDAVEREGVAGRDAAAEVTATSTDGDSSDEDDTGDDSAERWNGGEAVDDVAVMRREPEVDEEGFQVVRSRRARPYRVP